MRPEFLPFIASVVFSLLVWSLLARRYIWPRLAQRNLRAAAEPILYLNLFRFIGLAFLMPGVVAPGLAPEWSHPAAFGDLIAALLAALTLASGDGPSFRPTLWLFNLWGSLDLLRALATGPAYDVPAFLQSATFIPVLGVPLLLCAHAMLFILLLRKPAFAAAPG